MSEVKHKQIRENEFVAEFIKLISEKKSEQALTLLISDLPRILASNINRKEKLNHLLFMPRMIQRTGDVKHGTMKLLRKAESVVNAVKLENLRSRKLFVDFGAGAHDPIALCTYFYLNGFDRVVANDMLPPRNEVYSALAMRDIITDMYINPTRFLLPGSDEATFFKRLSEFDIDAFADGRFFDGFAGTDGRIRYVIDDIVKAELPEKSASLFVSFAVFEHVMDMAAVCKFIRDHTEPGGYGFHFIDLADHRAYRHDGAYNQFSFLTEEVGPSNINRLRASEQIAFFKNAGFDILHQSGSRVAVPEDTRGQFIVPWADMSEADQETINLTLLVRRPTEGSVSAAVKSDPKVLGNRGDRDVALRAAKARTAARS